jgi:frataxin-like iron-binding protein CyaY
MPEDKFHKLADDTIHDLLEKLEVMYLSVNSSYP